VAVEEEEEEEEEKQLYQRFIAALELRSLTWSLD